MIRKGFDMLDVQINDYTKDGKCSSCGQCCSNLLPLSNREVKTIKQYIKKHNIKEQRHNAMMLVDMTCPFRDETNKKCLIYEIRPQICRQFMCNHSKEDIKKTKFDFHQRYTPVFMRNEFYGNEEDVAWFMNILRGD